MYNQDKPKVYTREEIKQIALGYRGKPENFDPTKVGKKYSQPKKKTRGPATAKVTHPTHHLGKSNETNATEKYAHVS